LGIYFQSGSIIHKIHFNYQCCFHVIDTIKEGNVMHRKAYFHDKISRICKTLQFSYNSQELGDFTYTSVFPFYVQ
jgi:hypothetical protein